MAWVEDTVATDVKVPSRSGPKRQLRPCKIRWAAVRGETEEEKKPARVLTGVVAGDEDAVSTLQTLTWRVPTVMRLLPIQAIWQIVLVHLLLA